MTVVPEYEYEYGEDELRVLLEKAVPWLPAPEGRLRRVRERVVRHRRRRRTVVAAAAGVSVLVLAGTLLPGTLLPGTLRGGSEPVPPAAPAPSVTAPNTAVRYPELGGLTLRLPASWHSLAIPSEPLRKVPFRGFAGTQELIAYESPCAEDGQDTCPLPLRKLRFGGALLTLRLESGPRLDSKTQNPAVLNELHTVSPSCRAIGGRQEYNVLLGGLPDRDSAINADLCASGGASRAVAEAQQMIADASFDDRTASFAPTPASSPTHTAFDLSN
ncbi:hypothetical protein ACIHCQ_02325 [Streptomyces sp. NPDC052236]|uniref:hypothetical protein n=1 Tax=Streptomyces sp. NPDC052236 TaxID=3365686 RepID=UPI0037D14C2A